jgi:hypothetical protein
MDDAKRLLAAETVPQELLRLLDEFLEAGIPLTVAKEALELVRVQGAAGLRPAADLLASVGLEETLLAAVEALVLRSEVAVRNRERVLVRRPSEPSDHDG